MRLHRWPFPLRAPDDEGSAGSATGSGEPPSGQPGAGEGAPPGSTAQDGGAPPASSLVDFGKKGNGADPDPTGDQPGADPGDDADKDKPQTLTFKERPEWLPPNFWKADSGEVLVEALAKSQKDLRGQITKGADKAPDKPEAYEFKVGDELKDVEKLAFDNPDDDPIVKGFREFCHERKVPQALAAEAYEWFIGAVRDMLPELPDPIAEKKKLGNNGEAITNAIGAFFDQMYETGTLNDAEYKAVQSWFASAESVSAFQKVREWYGEAAIPYTAQVQEGLPSADELHAQMGVLMAKANDDPSAQAKFDKLQKQYEQLYGTEPAGSSRRAAI
ncbi:MAG: hypothetical protein QNJ94_18530 [Alphaproteobacteria bacterium]|nr:hypothetical protein [Alphaproteobacteria bacterium]